jgi:hypothetical protein
LRSFARVEGNTEQPPRPFDRQEGEVEIHLLRLRGKEPVIRSMPWSLMKAARASFGSTTAIGPRSILRLRRLAKIFQRDFVFQPLLPPPFRLSSIRVPQRHGVSAGRSAYTLR